MTTHRSVSPRSAAAALKPPVVAKVWEQRYSLKGCTLWRQSQFRSKHSFISPPRRLT
jgi:hypothetical protein